jgi:protein ImuB
MLPIDALVRRESRRGAGRVGGGAARERGAIVLSRAEGQRQVVACRCDVAAAAGVGVGMSVTEARALLPERLAARGLVRIETFDAARVAGVLRALAGWAQRFSPTVALDGEDGLCVDVSGCARLFRGEERLLCRALEGAAALGFSARGAIAPTFGCARAVARFGADAGRGVIVGQDGVRGVLEELPVRALGVNEETEAGLAEVGIGRIGELMRMPRASLPARFDDRVLLRLDMALGQAMETIAPVRVRGAIVVWRVFDGPTVQFEAIRLATRGLVGELSERLLACESGVRKLEVVLDRSDLGPARMSLELSRPSRDPRHVWGLIAPRLERIHLGYGVERIELRAARVGKLAHEQGRVGGSGCAWEPGRDAEAERAGAELIDVLGSKLGTDRVWRIELVESHVPERAWRARSACGEGTPRGGTREEMRVTGGERPTVVFATPRAVRVMSVTPDGPVAGMVWNEQELRVTACEGPERIAGEWWRDDRPTRDYFRVRDQHGRWLWVCREVERGRWFVHGVWA